MTTTITIPVDSALLLSLRLSREEFARQILFAGALALYRQHKLSLGKAAKLAEYSRMAFIEELSRRGEAIFDFSDEEVNDLITRADSVERLIESPKQETFEKLLARITSENLHTETDWGTPEGKEIRP
ncbi:MAG: UPF0175 family protein [Candidatus Kapabacteria bacterium]|jgi:predicted HTH domain antitoxin|nr:UPF0175 family protein [Candidatus Kapabacteria bacterium]